jgi:hypothetical protein
MMFRYRGLFTTPVTILVATTSYLDMMIWVDGVRGSDDEITTTRHDDI